MRHANSLFIRELSGNFEKSGPATIPVYDESRACLLAMMAATCQSNDPEKLQTFRTRSCSKQHIVAAQGVQ
jgi:hypothetical protein